MSSRLYVRTLTFRRLPCLAVPLATPTRSSTNAQVKPCASTDPPRYAAEQDCEMSCYHPLRAWRTSKSKAVVLTKKPPPFVTAQLQLPCGKCIGCQQAHALAWALRCTLEQQLHDTSVFTTLTYDEKHRPPTLDRTHLQRFFKRLRKALGPARTIRYFASGEYGTRTHRPHYHAILYGLHTTDSQLIQDKWDQGHTRTEPVTGRRISYVAGYTDKPAHTHAPKHKRISPDGEEYIFQPPFIQMSRNPGIAAHARQWPQSWKLYAIHNYAKMPVPRYLHQAWLNQATPQEQQELIQLRHQYITDHAKTDTQLKTEETIAKAKQQQKQEQRQYA